MAEQKAELDRRLRQIEAAARVAHTALTQEDAGLVLDAAVRIVAETLEVELVKLLERLPDGTGFTLRSAFGWRPELVGTVVVGVDSAAHFTATKGAGPVIVEDFRTETRFPVPPLLLEHGAVSGVSVSIADEGGTPFGMLGADSRRKRLFDHDDANFLQSVADTLAATLKRAATAEALRLQEREYRAMFELAGVGQAQADPHTLRFTRVNRKLCEITGYSATELMAMTAYDITHPDDRASDLARIRGLKPGADEWTSRKRYLRKDGQVVWVQVSGSLLRDEAGAPLHTVAAIEDVTTQHLAEEAVRRSEERFHQLADSVPPMVWTATPEGVPTYFNQRWYDLTGLTPAESLTRDGWVSLLHPEEAEATGRAWHEAVRTGTPYEVEVRYRQPQPGGYRWQLVRARPIRDSSGAIVRWFGSVTDIDERKRSEAAYRTLARSLPGLVYRVLLQDGNRTVLFNDTLTQLTGYAEEELHNGGRCPLAPLILPEDRPLTEAAIQKAIDERRAFAVEYRLRRRDGEVRFVTERGRVVLDDEGRPLSIDGVIFDVTDRKVAENALRQAHDELDLRVRERTVALARANEELRSQIQEREHAEWQLRLQSERLGILHDIDRAVLEARSPRETARAVVGQVRGLVPCERAAVALVDRRAGRLEILAASSEHGTALAEGHVVALDEVDLPLVEGEARAWLIADLGALAGPRAFTRALIAEGHRAYLALPLQVEGRLLGFLTLASGTPGAFDQDTVELTRQVAASLTVALHKAQLDEELRARRGELQTLLRRLVQVREDERRAVARDLHDDASQVLTSLMLGLKMLERELPGVAPALDIIASLKQSTEGVMGQLHDLAANLRPPALDRLGLITTLRRTLANLEARTGLRAALAVVGLEDDRFGSEVETALFHILQEALANVVAHAHAASVSVVLRRGERGILAVVEDDGRGFRPEEAPMSDSLGLVGMQEWAEMVGGRLTIESTLGKGTAVYAEVPYGDPDPDRG